MSESIVSQKFTKIHMVKMIKCVTGLDLKDSIKVVEDHLKIEDLKLPYDNNMVIEGREQIQDDLLDKMLSAQNNKEIDKQIKITQDVINNLEAELDRLREMRCCERG